jgi:hypothetical protein
MAKFKPKKRDCQFCGKPFMAVREWHVFCSRGCKLKNWRDATGYEDISKLSSIVRKQGEVINNHDTRLKKLEDKNG